MCGRAEAAPQPGKEGAKGAVLLHPLQGPPVAIRPPARPYLLTVGTTSSSSATGWESNLQHVDLQKTLKIKTVSPFFLHSFSLSLSLSGDLPTNYPRINKHSVALSCSVKGKRHSVKDVKFSSHLNLSSFCPQDCNFLQ